MTDINTCIGNSDAFPILRKWHFFNHAGVAPVPHVSSEAMRQFAREVEEGAYLGTKWYNDIEKLRQSAAKMLNAHRDEVAFVKNTSEGLATAAFGLEWKSGDRVVTTAVEYPANIYPWMELQRRHGVELVTVPEETAADGRRHVSIDRILEAADHPRTRLISLSHVEFASGQRLDIARIGRFCRENGKLFVVDAIQSLGVLPLDVQAMKIDYLSADGHKWLLGPEGAGIFYCRRELLQRTRPLVVGWMNVINAEQFGDYDYTLRDDAGRFESGSFNVVGLMGLKASLELLLSLGSDAISQRLKHLGDRFIAGASARGYRIISPRSGEQWSGIVSFTSDHHNQDTLQRTLRKQHQTEIAVRENRLRISPHFYNTDEQIDRLIDLLPGHE
jgi:cysteine desulfurase / selenocysteine lyase